MAWAGVGFQACALIAVLWLQEWSGAWTIALFLVFTGGFLAAQDKIADLLDFLVVVGAIINAVGWAWDLFDQYIWYDEVVHLFTTFAVTAALGHLIWRSWAISARPGGLAFFLLVVALGLVLGVFWEIAEALFLDLEWRDTVSDIVLDTLGGVGAALLLNQILSRVEITAARPPSPC